MREKYIEPEELAEVKKLDLLTYLSNYEPNELVMNWRQKCIRLSNQGRRNELS